MANDRCPTCGRKKAVKQAARRELRKHAAMAAATEAVSDVAARLGRSEKYVDRACVEFGVTPVRHRKANVTGLAYSVIAALQNTDASLAAISRDLEVSHNRVCEIRKIAIEKGVLFSGRPVSPT